MKQWTTQELLLLAATVLVGGGDLSEVLPGVVANSAPTFDTEECSEAPSPRPNGPTVTVLYGEYGHDARS